MVPWCYAKANIYDETLMKACSVELCRRAVLDLDERSPIPEHQLAPRNVQNTYWAYARVFQRRQKPAYLPHLFSEMSRISEKLLEHHPKDGPKTIDRLCVGYKTETGKLIPPDSFRLMSLGLIAQSYKDVDYPIPDSLARAMEEYSIKGLSLPATDCDKFFLMDSYDVVLASRTLNLTPALMHALKQVCQRHAYKLKPQEMESLRALGLIA